MAGGGFILGGLLTGLGRGTEMTALQAREDALERLRSQRQVETENRGEERQIRAEKRSEQASVRGFEREYTAKTGLLSLAQKFKKQETESEREYEIRLQDIKSRQEENLTRLRSFLDTQRDAASQRLSAEIDSGKIDTTEVDSDGFIVKVFKDGRTETTGIKARQTASELEIGAEEKRRQEKRDEIDRRNGKSPKKSATEKADDNAYVPISANIYNEKYWQPALERVRRGDPNWAGLNNEQIRARIRRILQSQGYDAPKGY